MKYKKIYNELKQRQAQLKARLEDKERFGLEQSARDSIGELSLYDNHPADIGTEFFERGKDIALHEQVEREYEDVNKALEKFVLGTYGICERTGQKIPYDRLVASPTAKTIVTHANSEVSHDRPIEEEVLEGFDKYNFDDSDCETEFDAEDSYQAVARFNEIEGSPFDETEEELIGSVEQVEGFLATGMEGYVGSEKVQTLRNSHFDEYVNRES